jgi:hypothetical protein
MFKRASLSKIENVIAFSNCFYSLNFYVSYFILVIVHDFKALSLIKIRMYIKFYILFLVLINICLNLLYLKVNIKKYTS